MKALIENYEDKLECTEQWEGITEGEKQHLKTQWESSLRKLRSLLGSLYHYCRQVPVLGFNSARYDLNLAKSHLIPWLRADVDPQEGQDRVDINVIKKGSAYTQIGARKVQVLGHQQLSGWRSVLFCLPQSLQNSRSEILLPL